MGEEEAQLPIMLEGYKSIADEQSAQEVLGLDQIGRLSLRMQL